MIRFDESKYARLDTLIWIFRKTRANNKLTLSIFSIVVVISRRIFSDIDWMAFKGTLSLSEDFFGFYTIAKYIMKLVQNEDILPKIFPDQRCRCKQTDYIWINNCRSTIVFKTFWRYSNDDKSASCLPFGSSFRVLRCSTVVIMHTKIYSGNQF